MGTFCGKTTVKFRDKKLVENFSAGKNNSQPTKIYTLADFLMFILY